MHLLQAVRIPVEREMGSSFFTLAEADLTHSTVQSSTEQSWKAVQNSYARQYRQYSTGITVPCLQYSI